MTERMKESLSLTPGFSPVADDPKTMKPFQRFASRTHSTTQRLSPAFRSRMRRSNAFLVGVVVLPLCEIADVAGAAHVRRPAGFNLHHLLYLLNLHACNLAGEMTKAVRVKMFLGLSKTR